MSLSEPRPRQPAAQPESQSVGVRFAFCPIFDVHVKGDIQKALWSSLLGVRILGFSSGSNSRGGYIQNKNYVVDEVLCVLYGDCLYLLKQSILQRSKKWLVRGLVKFAAAVARLVCPDLLG